MQNELETLIEQNNIPGVSVAILSNNGELSLKTAGITNQETKQRVMKETIFEAASLSKPVFAYIVLKMVERGELDLDTPLCDYKFDFGPEKESIRNPQTFPDNYKKLTARLILSHQAGLPNEFGEKYEYVSAVGKSFDYSGEAYRFLLDVVKQIAKVNELDDLAKPVFKDLKMMDSNFSPPIKPISQAVGHLSNSNVDKSPHYFFPHPAASLFTTASDYGKFLKACLTDSFIRKHMFGLAVTELSVIDSKAIKMNVDDGILKQMGWGLGIGLQKNKDGSFTAFHWGDVNTCRNFVAINLATNQAVACFTNSANGPAVFRAIAEPVVGDLNTACQWLYQREGFQLQKSSEIPLSQNFKKNMMEITKQNVNPESSQPEEKNLTNPFKKTPDPY